MRRFVSVSACALALSVAASSSAHIAMSVPPARDFGKPGADAHKNGPCGAIPRTNTYTQYAVGQSVTVEFTETVDHRGCFQVLLSDANDQAFQILSQVNDPTGDVTPKKRMMTVTLPAGKSCPSCTLAVRQLMIGQACAANQASITAGDTYFTCSDICIGATCPPKGDAGPPPPDASVPTTDGGPNPPGPDTGPSPTPTGSSPTTPPTTAPTGSGGASSGLSDAEGGCSSAPLEAGGASGMAFLAASAALVIVARRRRR